MRTRRNSCSAFTIVELLVAAAITVVIVVLLGTMFGSLMKTSMRANQRTDSFREARAALQMMKRDLANLVRAQPSAYFTMMDLYSDPNTSTAKNRQLYALCALKNQPPGVATNTAGDMCALGYYCRWDTDRYTLRRHFRDSATTFAAFQANGSGIYMAPIHPTIPAASLYTPVAADDILATNVWNLQITAYKADGTIDATYPLVIDAAPTVPPAPPAAPVTLPAAIEISFNAMSSEAARTIRSISTSADDWMDPATSNHQRLIAPNTYEFRTRLSF
jgi:type II secretory pathway pseudopilin PulG